MDEILESLINWNTDKIKELEQILSEYQDKTSTFKQTRISCFDKLIPFSHSWCGLPFGIYGDVYYDTLERPPSGKEFNVEMGSMGAQPSGWVELNTTQKDDFEKKLPDAEPAKKTLMEVSEVLRPLIREIIDENSIVKNFHDFDDEYSELIELDKKWLYPREEAIKKYIKKEVIIRDITLAQSGMVYPYHSKLLAFYDFIYTTADLIEGKMETTIRILKRINRNLPFAKMKQNEIAQPSNVSIGTYVHGNGNILNETSSYANSGKMTLNIENDSQMDELLKDLLKSLEETNDLNGYQKDDVAEDVNKIITELGKPTENQDKGFIKHTLGKIWGVTKDVVTVSASLTSIAIALGITL